MATSVRGRGGSRARSTFGRPMFFGGQPGQSGWARTGTAGKRSTSRKFGKSSVAGGTSAGYKGCNTSFANKIQSFKMLFGQTTGPARLNRPSPATLNSFANWINKGAVVQTVTTAQVARWAKATRKNFNGRTPTPAACKNVLCAKFGKSAIKAVARTKSGSFMVVTTPTVKGKRFCFPK